MDKQEILELMDRFTRSGLNRMKLTRGDCSLELERGGAAVPAAETAAPERTTEPAPGPGEGEAVTAPLAGIFYAAPGPDQPPFVKAGQRVGRGETLCLLEAMKMMSEVAAPCDCVIQEVLKANGELAAFGEPLFRYRPC